ncbi:UNVERIFIED_CONTAM: hypothetical protein Slati_0376800 [Sesamum latifolium]|uniref:Uncharacterized protein n=1 Tax=Sesamum latifolium TaxID=2727402 RepID=A0AAW2YGE7_9LAMI
MESAAAVPPPHIAVLPSRAWAISSQSLNSPRNSTTTTVSPPLSSCPPMAPLQSPKHPLFQPSSRHRLHSPPPSQLRRLAGRRQDRDSYFAHRHSFPAVTSRRR